MISGTSPTEVRYDFFAILTKLMMLLSHEANWEPISIRPVSKPLRITYESLTAFAVSVFHGDGGASQRSRARDSQRSLSGSEGLDKILTDGDVYRHIRERFTEDFSILDDVTIGTRLVQAWSAGSTSSATSAGEPKICNNQAVCRCMKPTTRACVISRPLDAISFKWRPVDAINQNPRCPSISRGTPPGRPLAAINADAGSQYNADANHHAPTSFPNAQRSGAVRESCRFVLTALP